MLLFDSFLNENVPFDVLLSNIGLFDKNLLTKNKT